MAIVEFESDTSEEAAQNEDPRTRLTTITMVGPSNSGKTHLVSTLTGSPASLHDLRKGLDALHEPALTRSVDRDNLKEDEENWGVLTDHYEKMLYGMDSEGPEGTVVARSYRFRLRYKRPKPPGFGAFGRMMRDLTGSNPMEPHDLNLSIYDGRGGDLTRTAKVDDEYVAKRREKYLSSLQNSRGLVLCLPCVGREATSSALNTLALQVEIALDEKENATEATPLQNIAICMTKYEALFTQYGGSAGSKALERSEALAQIARIGMKEILSRLDQISTAHGVRIQIFPVSTYGFVAESGAANFYPWKHGAGLLTRAVTEQEYELFDANADDRGLSRDDYGLRDHYPVELSEADVRSLWHPFNIAPPILFAATGLVTGPLNLGIHEVV